MGQQSLPPGFRFSPTDEELVSYYLKSKALGRLGRSDHLAAIADVDVYKFEPWDLPEKSALPTKDQEWYFFSSQDKKYSHTARINRTTKKGYWKATGKDRKVLVGCSVIGLKKTLIYYEGRAPNGSRTNWIMHEYRLDEDLERKENVVCGVVLCRIRKKGGPGPRNGEQYGAPILNESGEQEEEMNLGKVDNVVDTACQAEAESKVRGNAYNLQDQVEVWKLPVHTASSNVALDYLGTKDKEAGIPKLEPECYDFDNLPDRRGTAECDPDLKEFFQSISDTPYFDTSLYEHGGGAFPCYYNQFLDMQNPGTFSDLDTLPFLPTVLDPDGYLRQDNIGPAFDESEILREMSDLINDGKGVSGSMGPNEKLMPHSSCNVFLKGDYIELDDIKAPLDGFSSRPSTHMSELGSYLSELGSSADQQLLFKADSVETSKNLNSQGLAGRRASYQVSASNEGFKADFTVLPQAKKGIAEGEISIPISRENYRNAGEHYLGSYSGAGAHPPHVVESTKSYLSKHMATYAVSKHEMQPAQLCYASFTDGQACVVALNDPVASKAVAAIKGAVSSKTAAAVKGKCNAEVDVVRKLPGTPIDLQSSTSLLTKSSKMVDAESRKKIAATSIYSFLPSSSAIKSSSSNVEVPSVSRACDPKAEHVNMSYSHRHRWKAPFRGLMSKAKRSALGTRLVELENGMRAKFNDKLSVLGKPAGRFLPNEDNLNPYDSLRQGVVATLCQLAAAVLSFFCLFWGFRVSVSHAFGVSV